MDKKLIDKYIAIPLAISLFNGDREEFKDFKVGNVYLDMVDSAMDKLTKEFQLLKRDLNKQRVEVKRIDPLQYTVNGNVLLYTSDQLKEMTRSVMQECLSSMDIK